MPLHFGKERVKLYAGLVPVGHGIFHRLVVREGIIPHIDPDDLTLREWTTKRYYEVVVNESVYDNLAAAFKQ
jgi:hypothetical protein